MSAALLWYLLAALIVLDTLRGRKKLRELPVAGTPDPAPSEDYALLLASGAAMDDAGKSAAVGLARRTGADAVVLIAQQQSAIAALGVIQIVDPDSLRQDRLARVKIPGSAVLVKREILERAQLEEGPHTTEQLRQAAAKVRRYAAGQLEHAVVPGLRAADGNPYAAWKAYRGLFGPASGALLILTFLSLVLLGLGVWLYPWAGAAALLAFHLQPALMLAGGPFQARGLLVVTALRSPLALWEALGLVAGSFDGRERSEQVRALRPVYQQLYAENRDRFFEQPRSHCPVCSRTRLRRHLRTGDLFQNKPGEFRLDRCADCEHVFQNPRLAPPGLDYYYRDFYDGLGRESAEAFFGFGVKNQEDQVAAVLKITRPRRWLDVGGGHGHLCQVAKRQLPDTRFEGLDLSDSIEEAERAGWIDKGYRGMFPSTAPALEDQFDLVSMFHYLEHTADQRAELAAAYRAVAPGGHVVIEVPNPESAYSKLFGKYWLPWFQPQHLHLIRAANLERLLREAGFEPLDSSPVRGSEKTAWLFAAVLLTHRLGPEPDVPWREPASALGRCRFYAVQAVSPLMLAAAAVADRLAAGVADSAKLANAYRVIARSTKAG